MEEGPAIQSILAIGAFGCGAIVGAIINKPILSGVVSGTISCGALLVYLATHERSSQWLEVFALISPFLPVVFILCFAIGYGGGLFGNKIFPKST